MYYIQVQTLSCSSSLNNKYFFSNYNAFTCYFHCSIISYDFMHSLLMTHFTSYYYTFKIAWVSCIFTCSYSLSVKITPIFYDFNDTCRRVKWGEHTWDLRNTGYPSLTTPTHLKPRKSILMTEHWVEMYSNQKEINYISPSTIRASAETCPAKLHSLLQFSPPSIPDILWAFRQA